MSYKKLCIIAFFSSLAIALLLKLFGLILPHHDTGMDSIQSHIQYVQMVESKATQP